MRIHALLILIISTGHTFVPNEVVNQTLEPGIW